MFLKFKKNAKYVFSDTVARCYGWVATSKKRSQIGNFAPTRPVWSKISGRSGHPPPIILHFCTGS